MSMIDRSVRTILNRMLLTLRKSKLQHVGIFSFIVKKKSIVQLKQQALPTYCLFVIEKDEKYKDTVVVSKEEYKHIKVGQMIPCSVIKHESGIKMVSIQTDKDDSIRKLVKKSQLQLLGVIVGLSFVVLTLSFFYMIFKDSIS